MSRSNFVVSVMDNNENQEGKHTVFIRANALADVTGLQEDWDTGSILWDIMAKKLYMLDKSGTWVEQ